MEKERGMSTEPETTEDKEVQLQKERQLDEGGAIGSQPTEESGQSSADPKNKEQKSSEESKTEAESQVPERQSAAEEESGTTRVEKFEEPEVISLPGEVKCEIVKRSHGELDKIINVPTMSLVEKPKPGCSYYEVLVSTGEEEGTAAFDRGIYLVIEGTKASSGKLYVRKLFSIASSKGAAYLLQIEASGDLGEILVTTVGSDPEQTSLFDTGGKPWFVEFVIIHNFQSKYTTTFPCYHWIAFGGSISLTYGTATLKTVAGYSVLVEYRKNQIESRRRLYQWHEYPGTMLPSGFDLKVAELPLDEEFDYVKHLDFANEIQKSKVVQAVTAKRLTSKHLTVEYLRDFEVLAESETAAYEPKPIYELGRWTRDVEFGFQLLNGVNPRAIRKCTSIPHNFPVTSEMVQGSLTKGSSLEDEMKNGHVYICDLKILDGIPCREYFHCSSPLCLLAVNGNGDLVPIAIQLKQKPGDDNPIFLPSDNWIDWLMAKMHFQNAFVQVHQIVAHYLSCHFIMEAYIVATMRNLPDQHPVFKLLRPHMRTTLSINSRVRETLLNNGGMFDQLSSLGEEGRNELYRRAAGEYQLQWNNISKDLKERGVDNQEELPGYHYRDDGLKIWNALQHYVEGVVALFYETDEDVANDPELQNWAEDMYVHGSPKRGQGEPECGIPRRIESKELLVEVCTTVIFTATALHAAVTAPQYRYYSFVPNAPFSMAMAPPAIKGVADMAMLMASLPNEEMAAKGVSMSLHLSQYASTKAYTERFPHLASFNYQWFTEQKAKDLITNLRVALDIISMQIRDRNRHLDEPYTALIPELIPSSVTI